MLALMYVMNGVIYIEVRRQREKREAAQKLDGGTYVVMRSWVKDMKV